jgi:hypothetical protein
VVKLLKIWDIIAFGTPILENLVRAPDIGIDIDILYDIKIVFNRN